MMNVLILAATKEGFDTHDGAYPLCLTEIDGIPVIERIVSSCRSVSPCNFTVALREEDVRRYHLDNIVAILAPGAHVLRVPEETCGAACTALLAANRIDNDQELLIISGNELLDTDLSVVLADFRARKLDAGTVTFPSVHPRYSYVRLDNQGLVVEAAEKNPISRHATIGMYWFARGGDFVSGAQNMIRKDAHVNGVFFIAPVFNELVLEQARIGIFSVDSTQYHPLKTERQLHRFETSVEQGRVS